MKKPKRYDKNYTATENRTLRTLKGQGWSNKEIAQHMGRTEIGISRHWSNINKTKPVVRKRDLNSSDIDLIIETMKDVCSNYGFKVPNINYHDDRNSIRGNKGHAFKVNGGYKWPDWIWDKCLQAVSRLGYPCTLGHPVNYYTNTAAHSRGLRVKY